MSVMEKLIFLSGTLWLSAIAFIVYAWITQARQNAVLRYIARRLDSLEKRLKAPESDASQTQPPIKPNHPETSISIDKNEPLSKYETVTLPDEININFVDR